MGTGRRCVMAAVVAGGALLLLAAPAGAADPRCDAYSGHCPHVDPFVVHRPPTVVQADTLPFTGGELVLMSAAGIAAVGVGTSVVVAARRRRAA
jgi:hypothetical protein